MENWPQHDHMNITIVILIKIISVFCKIILKFIAKNEKFMIINANMFFIFGKITNLIFFHCVNETC